MSACLRKRERLRKGALLIFHESVYIGSEKFTNQVTIFIKTLDPNPRPLTLDPNPRPLTLIPNAQP